MSGDPVAFAEYRREGNGRIALLHPAVPEALFEKGVGQRT